MAVTLINTSPARAGDETLTEIEVLRSLGRKHEIHYRPDGSNAELLGMRKLRNRLDAIVQAPDDPHRFAMLNELSYSAAAIPQIVTHPEDPRPHFHYTLEDASYIDHLKGITAYALSRLIIIRNGKRLYCSSRTCGSRIHAARYRGRFADRTV